MKHFISDITTQMLEAAAEVLYGHPRSRAREWAKEDKFDSCVNTAMRR